MLVPFVTGFAKGAGDIIDERDKEIRETVNDRMNILLKKREQALQQATTRRDELKEQAKQLQALSGNRLTETQIAGIIESGEVDTVITNLRKNSGVMSDEQLAQLYTPEKDYTGTVESVVGKMTELKRAPDMPGLEDEQRTAFGLKTTAAAEAKRKFASAANVTVDDLYKNRLEKISDFKPAGRLDMRVFATPETDTVVKARLRDNLSEATQGLEPGTEGYNKALGRALSSNKVKTDLTKIRAMLVVDALSDEEGGQKPRTSSQINTIITNSLRNGLDVLVTKGVVRWDPTREDYVPITGDVNGIASFIEQKNLIIRDVLTARGLIDREGRILGGRNAEDAIAPYANIEDGRIVSWKNAATKKVDPQELQSSTRMPTPEVYAQVINGMKMPEGERIAAIDAYTKAYGYNVKIAKEANPNAGRTLTGIEEKRARANALIASSPALEATIRANFKTETGEDL